MAISRTVCGGLTGLIILFFLLCLFSQSSAEGNAACQYFSFQPMRDIANPLRMLLQLFVHQQLVLVLCFAAILLTCGTTVEREMGRWNFIKLIAFTAVTTVVTMTFFCFMVAVVGLPLWWKYYNGAWPLIEAVLVAQCRTRAAASLALPWSGLLRIRLQQLPFTFFLFSLLWSLTAIWRGTPSESATTTSTTTTLTTATTSTAAPTGHFNGFDEGPAVLSAACGWGFSWYYLRYCRGESSAAFAFDNFFFPEKLQVAVRNGGGALYRRLLQSPLRRLVSGTEVSSQNNFYVSSDDGTLPAAVAALRSGSGGGGAAAVVLPGSTHEDAERHRSIAIEALTRRLQQLSAASSAAAPTV